MSANQGSNEYYYYTNDTNEDDSYSSMERWLVQGKDEEPWTPVNPRVSGGSGHHKSKGKKESKSKDASSKSKSGSKSRSGKH